MTSRGWRFVTLRLPREEVTRAMRVLARYPFVEGVRETAEGVSCTLDLALLPPGDGPAAEMMIRRDVERAAALHAEGL